MTASSRFFLRSTTGSSRLRGWARLLSAVPLLVAASPLVVSSSPAAAPDPAVRSTAVEALRVRMNTASWEEPPSAPLRCPGDMALVALGGPPYCVDAYEASLVEVLPDQEERPWPYYAPVPGDVDVRAVSRAGVYPQGYISGVRARAACERSGKRLCRPIEWRAACMGPQATTFPYGDARVTGRCNDNGLNGMRILNPWLDDRPEHHWMWGFAGNMVDPRLNQLAGTLARTGERAGCTNGYGVFDMVGNLHEWVADPDGTFQGGFYLDTHINGDGCFYRTTFHPMSYFDYSTGFRCCADAVFPP